MRGGDSYLRVSGWVKYGGARSFLDGLHLLVAHDMLRPMEAMNLDGPVRLSVDWRSVEPWRAPVALPDKRVVWFGYMAPFTVGWSIVPDFLVRCASEFGLVWTLRCGAGPYSVNGGVFTKDRRDVVQLQKWVVGTKAERAVKRFKRRGQEWKGWNEAEKLFHWSRWESVVLGELEACTKQETDKVCWDEEKERESVYLGAP